MQQAAFAVLALVTLASAVKVVTARNLLHSALWLVLAFFGIAGTFILLEAEFLAVVQILVYVGAISILFIFAIMLSQNYADPLQPRVNAQWQLVAGFAVLLFVALAAIVTRVAWPVAFNQVPADTIERLGAEFVGTYVVPFEVASVLLVAAMIGAIIVARERE